MMWSCCCWRKAGCVLVGIDYKKRRTALQVQLKMVEFRGLLANDVKGGDDPTQSDKAQRYSAQEKRREQRRQRPIEQLHKGNKNKRTQSREEERRTGVTIMN